MGTGLYIHIPFCVKKCHYCDFISYPFDPNDARAYLKAAGLEMCSYGKLLTSEEREVSSLFIGGGTPTCLPAGKLVDLIKDVSDVFELLPGCEITVEANPGTITREGLIQLAGVGVNRLSIGVQSFQDHLLKVLGRIHDARSAFKAVQAAREAGFENVNLDLIFGIPGQTAGDWLETLRCVSQLSPEHVSVYGLQLEDGTPLERAVARGQLVTCPEDLELSMYSTAIDFLAEHGYEHYEISNFARPGKQSVHNLKYWLLSPYLGIGAGAHSCLRGRRFANETSLESYLDKVFRGKYPVKDWEEVSERKAMAEFMFLGLRLLRGVDLGLFYQRFGKGAETVYGSQMASLSARGLVETSEGCLRLSRQGLPVANLVFREFV
ncbi:MAG: Oxygen-independent coproporphyrinogen-III oxidase 1 [Firmicutes bacterium ADurb.Bin456]|nr:MAG: Oxygen-independent coproporphyrinogen-III oxidase 1 [Firmicutes bacterium ADurb.Bin456]